MLEKNSKIFYDSHFHYSDCLEKGCFNPPSSWKGCSCAHSIEEWNIQCGEHFLHSFGIHPQFVADNDSLLEKYFLFQQNLLEENKLDAIGETGFDFFNENFKRYSVKQEKYFVLQLEAAIKFNKPLIIHCRKANEKLFYYSKLLKQVPAVLFHSFMGTSIEAKSLLNKGINGFFSFGKQIMNNNKKVIDCVKNIPSESLLLETDAPFQFLKNESMTPVADIEKVYESVSQLKQMDLESLFYLLENNFYSLFVYPKKQ